MDRRWNPKPARLLRVTDERYEHAAFEAAASFGLVMSAEFVKLPVIAEYFGVPVSTVRSWCARGRLPSVKPGRHRLVLKRDFTVFCAQNARGGALGARLG